MQVIAQKKLDSPEEFYYNSSIDDALHTLQVNQSCYVYISQDGDLLAANVSTFATPADERFFLGRYNPRWS